jgi:LppP/LprE lipoprotein
VRRVRRLLALAVVLAVTAASASAASDPRLAAAVKVVRSKGYRVDSTRTWEPSVPLNALIGTFAKSADGYNKRAFFFYRGRYLGTDSSAPSAQISELWSDDRTIALLYVLYRGSDPLCCPTGGGKIVRFRWNGRRLVALDRIPPLSGSLHR